MRKQVYSQRRAGVRSLVLFLLAAALLLFLLLRTDRAVRPNLEAVCASETKRYATQVLADSVGEVLSPGTRTSTAILQRCSMTIPAMSPLWRP